MEGTAYNHKLLNKKLPEGGRIIFLTYAVSAPSVRRQQDWTAQNVGYKILGQLALRISFRDFEIKDDVISTEAELCAT